MLALHDPAMIMFGAGLLLLGPFASAELQPPEHVGIYYSGPPCSASEIDRTYAQFQVNLAPEPRLEQGVLLSGPTGEAVLLRGPRQALRLLSNASRADWLLAYPMTEEPVAVWGRPILEADCSVAQDSFYVEAIFPPRLLDGPIDPALDLLAGPGDGKLQEAVRAYRWELMTRSARRDHPDERPEKRRGSAAERLEREFFSPENARGLDPWRALLVGPDEPVQRNGSVEILLSGSDGSMGMFGHIAVGVNGMVYNIYPKGSERGAPGMVPIWDYLFNAQRGQALRRPTWVLRLEGLPPAIVSAFKEDLDSRVGEMDRGTIPYHPTGNNCTTTSIEAMGHLGLEVPAARYFTRRFPRPAFGRVLEQIPELVRSGRLPVERAELAFIPQVPVRPLEGGAPNRPLRDRAKLD